MTSRSYFGKMNSILGSVVPLAMFALILHCSGDNASDDEKLDFEIYIEFLEFFNVSARSVLVP